MGSFEDDTNYWILRWKFRLLAVSLILFFVSACTTVNETRYFIFGKSTRATVDSFQAQSDHAGEWCLKCTFSDQDGKPRSESIYGGGRIEGEIDPGSVVEVQYIPGSSDSRVQGHRNLWLMLPFLASLIVAGVVGWKFMREYREHERRSARST